MGYRRKNRHDYAYLRPPELPAFGNSELETLRNAGKSVESAEDLSSTGLNQTVKSASQGQATATFGKPKTATGNNGIATAPCIYKEEYQLFRALTWRRRPTS